MDDSSAQDRWQRWLARPLLVFVLISIGFALGRLTMPAAAVAGPGATASAGADEAAQAGVAAGPSRVIVSYMHGNIRCVSCDTIERLLREVVERHYADALASGRVVRREVNFDHDPTLAKRYDVASSMPVISWEVAGREAGFVRMDDVWNLIRDEAAFEDAVTAAVDAALDRLPAPESDASSASVDG